MKLSVFFNAKAIHGEKQQWYYLTHSWKDKEFHTFPKNIKDLKYAQKKEFILTENSDMKNNTLYSLKPGLIFSLNSMKSISLILIKTHTNLFLYI